MNLFSDNHCVSISPSKLEGVPAGQGRVSVTMAVLHTPPALRATSPNLGEDTPLPLRGGAGGEASI